MYVLFFLIDNESKAFYPSYDQRNTLVAYSLQEKYGKFNSEKAIPLGALDFVGHDRRYLSHLFVLYKIIFIVLRHFNIETLGFR